MRIHFKIYNGKHEMSVITKTFQPNCSVCMNCGSIIKKLVSLKNRTFELTPHRILKKRLISVYRFRIRLGYSYLIGFYVRLIKLTGSKIWSNSLSSHKNRLDFLKG